jgi:hypothetical protein
MDGVTAMTAGPHGSFLMSIEHTCSRCGTERPANAPAGLCPRCLLRLGLGAGLRAGGLTDASGTSSGAAGPSPASGLLSDLDMTVGHVPRVHLRDVSTDATRPARTLPESLPGLAGDGGAAITSSVRSPAAAWVSC